MLGTPWPMVKQLYDLQWIWVTLIVTSDSQFVWASSQSVVCLNGHRSVCRVFMRVRLSVSHWSYWSMVMHTGGISPARIPDSIRWSSNHIFHLLSNFCKSYCSSFLPVHTCESFPKYMILTHLYGLDPLSSFTTFMTHLWPLSTLFKKDNVSVKKINQMCHW